MKKKPTRKAAAAPRPTQKEQDQEQARRLLKRSLAREREIRALSRSLQREIGRRNVDLRALQQFITVLFTRRSEEELHQALDTGVQG